MGRRRGDGRWGRSRPACRGQRHRQRHGRRHGRHRASPSETARSATSTASSGSRLAPSQPANMLVAPCEVHTILGNGAHAFVFPPLSLRCCGFGGHPSAARGLVSGAILAIRGPRNVLSGEQLHCRPRGLPEGRWTGSPERGVVAQDSVSKTDRRPREASLRQPSRNSTLIRSALVLVCMLGIMPGPLQASVVAQDVEVVEDVEAYAV